MITLAGRTAFIPFLGDDDAALRLAEHIHLVVSWSFVLFGVSFVLTSVVRATGAVVPRVILVVSLIPLRALATDLKELVQRGCVDELTQEDDATATNAEQIHDRLPEGPSHGFA